MAAGAIRFHGYISWLPDRDRQRQTETDRHGQNSESNITEDIN